MASTNKTAHYEFPQYIGSDIPNILTDINPTFETIDTALYEQGQQIAEQTTDLSDIQEAVDQATADVAVMQSSIVTMGGILETTRQLATDNKETIGQGTLDTVAQTLIGGVNELKAGTLLGSVSGSASKTWTAALNELFAAIQNKISHNKRYILNAVYSDTNRTDTYYAYQYSDSNVLLSQTQIGTDSLYCINIEIKATESSVKVGTLTNSPSFGVADTSGGYTANLVLNFYEI